MERIRDIEVVSCTIESLLSATKKSIVDTEIMGQLFIPEYQRPYVWGQKQIMKLISDLNEFAESNKSSFYYLGSFIIHSNVGKLNIIDGQQRLTTLMILQLFQDEKQLSNIIYDSPLSADRIKKNIIFLKQKIEDSDIKLSRIDFSRINITLVVTKSEDLAYTFFETQNTGGKRLSGADIIKSHHLRAVHSSLLIGLQAKRWESKKMNSIEYVINILAKVRFWNVLKWNDFPFYRNDEQIKKTVVGEFTEKSRKKNLDITYRNAEVSKIDHQEQIKYSSIYKAIRQPLYDGNNYLDFLMDYVDLYEIFFKDESNYAVDEEYYVFRNKLINGQNGTLFLKELFEISLITYVSKFGFNKVYEFSLWSFRYIYAVRVINQRTVREDSIFKFVKDELIIDKILNSFDETQVLQFLKSYTYVFSDANCEKNKVKGKYIMMLGNYFESNFSKQEVIKDKFDVNLKKAIKYKLQDV